LKRRSGKILAMKKKTNLSAKKKSDFFSKSDRGHREEGYKEAAKKRTKPPSKTFGIKMPGKRRSTAEAYQNGLPQI